MNLLITFLFVLAPLACGTPQAQAQAQAAPAPRAAQVAPAAPAQNKRAVTAVSSSNDGYHQLTINDGKGDLLLVMHGERFTGILDGEVLPPERLSLEGDKLTVFGADGGPLYEVRVDSAHDTLMYPYDSDVRFWDSSSDPFGAAGFGGGAWTTSGLMAAADRKLIGVTTSAVGSALRAQLGLKEESFVIETVTPDMPAAKAGAKPFDVVTAIDGKTGASTERLREVLDSKKPGDKLKLSILRGGQAQELELTVEEAKVRARAGAMLAPGQYSYSMAQGMPSYTVTAARAEADKVRAELAEKMAALQKETEKLSAAQSGEGARQLEDLARRQAEIAEQLREREQALADADDYVGVLEQGDNGSRWLMLPRGGAAAPSPAAPSADRLGQIEDRLARLEALLEKLAANTSKSGEASGSKP
jgi:hypothetical protein